MRQVAGVVVGRLDPHFSGGCPELQAAHKLGRILHFFREAGCLFLVDRIVFEQLAVFLHHRSATGRVDDEGIQLELAEDIDIPFGQRQGRLLLSVMQEERTAAGLGLGNKDFTAVMAQHLHGRLIGRSKDRRHHAA